MNSTQEADLKNRLLSQAVALVEKATGGTSEPLVVEALLAACVLLEDIALRRHVKTYYVRKADEKME